MNLFQEIMVAVETTMTLVTTVDSSSPITVPWKVVAALVVEVQAVPTVVNIFLHKKPFV